MPYAHCPVSSAVGCLAAALLLAGCIAATRDFPDLGDPPVDPGPVSGEAALSPISVPPPARDPARMDADAARALRRDAAARLDGLAGSIDPRIDALAKALQAAVDSGDAIDHRTAHFRFSRLSRLETELSALRRRLSALPAAGRADAELRDRADSLRARVADALATWRPALAALEAE